MSNVILVKGKERMWNSLAEACQALGMSQVRLEKEVHRGECELEFVYTDIPPRAKPVKCLESGELFRSFTELAEAVGMTVPAVSQSLRSGATVLQGKHYSLITPAEYVAEVTV